MDELKHLIALADSLAEATYFAEKDTLLRLVSELLNNILNDHSDCRLENLHYTVSQIYKAFQKYLDKINSNNVSGEESPF